MSPTGASCFLLTLKERRHEVLNTKRIYDMEGGSIPETEGLAAMSQEDGCVSATRHRVPSLALLCPSLPTSKHASILMCNTHFCRIGADFHHFAPCQFSEEWQAPGHVRLCMGASRSDQRLACAGVHGIQAGKASWAAGALQVYASSVSTLTGSRDDFGGDVTLLAARKMAGLMSSSTVISASSLRGESSSLMWSSAACKTLQKLLLRNALYISARTSKQSWDSNGLKFFLQAVISTVENGLYEL